MKDRYTLTGDSQLEGDGIHSVFSGLLRKTCDLATVFEVDGTNIQWNAVTFICLGLFQFEYKSSINGFRNQFSVWLFKINLILRN